MEKTNYLSNFKTEKEMIEAIEAINSVANRYYRSNPLKFKKMGYDAEDLELIIHEHLLIKFHNTGFMVNSIAALRQMCKLSMNATLRNIDLKFGRDLTPEEKEDKTLKTIKKEVVKIDNLSDLISDTKDGDYNFGENFLVDPNDYEEISLANVKMNNICSILESQNPDYLTIFKISTYLNDGINLINNDNVEMKIFELFSDLIVNNINDISNKSKSNINKNNMSKNKINKLTNTRNDVISNSINKYGLDNLNEFEKEFLLSKEKDIKKYKERLTTNLLLLTKKEINEANKCGLMIYKSLEEINDDVNKIVDEKVNEYIKTEKEKFINSKINSYKKEQEEKFKNLISVNRKRIKTNDIIKRLGINVNKKDYEDTFNSLCELLKTGSL